MTLSRSNDITRFPLMDTSPRVVCPSSEDLFDRLFLVFYIFLRLTCHVLDPSFPRFARHIQPLPGRPLLSLLGPFGDSGRASSPHDFDRIGLQLGSAKVPLGSSAPLHLTTENAAGHLADVRPWPGVGNTGSRPSPITAFSDCATHTLSSNSPRIRSSPIRIPYSPRLDPSDSTSTYGFS